MADVIMQGPHGMGTPDPFEDSLYSRSLQTEHAPLRPCIYKSIPLVRHQTVL